MPEDFTQATVDMLEVAHSTKRTMAPSPQKERIHQDVVEYFCKRLELENAEIRSAFDAVTQGERVILEWHVLNLAICDDSRPVCRFKGEQQFFRVLRSFGSQLALSTIAYVLDRAYIELCWTRLAACSGKPCDARFLYNPCIDLGFLISDIDKDQKYVEGQIKFVQTDNEAIPLRAVWDPYPQAIDVLSVLNQLAGLILGEVSPTSEDTSISGGSDSDVISTSPVDHLFNLFTSTRICEYPADLILANYFAMLSPAESGSNLPTIKEEFRIRTQEGYEVSAAGKEAKGNSGRDGEAKTYGDIIVQPNAQAHIGDQHINYHYHFNKGGVEHELDRPDHYNHDYSAWRPKQIGGRSYPPNQEHNWGGPQAHPTHQPSHTRYSPQSLNHNAPVPNLLDNIFNVLNDTIGTIVSTALRNIMPVLAVQLQAVAHWPVSPIKR